MFKNLNNLITKNNEITRKYLLGFIFVIFFSVLVAILELASISLIIPIITFYSTRKYSFNNDSFGFLVDLLLNYLSLNIFNLTIVFICILIITALGRIYLTYVMRIITNKLGNDLAIKLFKKVTGDDYTYHLKIDKTRIISSFNKIDYLMDGVLSPLFLSISSLIICILMVTFLLAVSFKLAIYSISSIAIIYFIISKIVNSKLIINSRRISELQTQNFSIISSSVHNIKSLIINQNSNVFQDEFKLIDLNRRMVMAKNNVIGIVPKYLIESFGLIAMLLILLFQSSVGTNNSIPLIAGILFAFQKMLPMVQTVYQSWTQIKGSDEVIKDVVDALDIEVINIIPKSKINANKFTFKNIKINNVYFKYSKNDPIVLNQINFEINKGDKIAIIGNSGVGKTTLIEVLLSLLNCTKGEILWDGNPITYTNMYHYRMLFSYVSQDVYLIEDTLDKNIAFTLDEKIIDYDKLTRSISSSNLEDFVNSLPEKSKTIIGKLRLLSGGQKQRIGIARALYQNSKILILDESTSNLDPKTEYEILQSLTQNNPDLTIILITHKYENLNLFDRTYKMSNGKIETI